MNLIMKLNNCPQDLYNLRKIIDPWIILRIILEVRGSSSNSRKMLTKELVVRIIIK